MKDSSAPTERKKETDPLVASGQLTRFGIKAKLSLTLTCLAGLTAIASGIAWLVFGNIDRSVTRMTHESAPSVIAALGLAEKSNEIAISVPKLLSSGSQDERVREETLLRQRDEELRELISGLTGTLISEAHVDALLERQAELSATISEMSALISMRLDLGLRRAARGTEVGRLHVAFLEAIEPLVDDSYFDLVMSGEQATAETAEALEGFVEGGVSELDLLLTLNAEINLAAGMLLAVLHLDEASLVQPIRERFVAAAAAAERSMRRLPEDLRTHSLDREVNRLLEFGRGPSSIFQSDEQGPTGFQATERSRAIQTVHENVLLTLTPMIDDAAFDLVLSTEEAAERNERVVTDLIDVGADLLHLLLTVRSEANLAAGLLNQAAVSLDANALLPLEERFVASENQILRMLGELPPWIDAAEIESLLVSLLENGKGNDGLFALRRAELERQSRAEALLQDSLVLTSRLNEETEALVEAALRNSREAAMTSAEAISSGKIWMIILAVGAVAGAGLVMYFYVGPRIIRPIEDITGAMADLAEGDTSVDIPGRDRRDELGRMAQALGVFRDTAIEVQKSNLRELEETRRRLSDAIESISEAFSLYDAEDRLVVCNSKYRSLLYPGIEEDITPGMKFEDIVRQAIERGYIQDAEEDPQEWLAERVERHLNPSGSHVQQRGDGRWILVSERKTADGGTVAVYSDITELKQREEELAEKSNTLEQLSNQLAKYLSPQVYESIFTGRQEVKLISERKKLTVFFSDIAGFTETADRLESEELTELLNHYLTEMSHIALKHGATIDKYVGDAIVIFFGDPETKGVKEDALACVEMAIEMRERMRDLQETWRNSGIENPLACRIGINTGFCTVGNFGSEDRMDYTIIGGGVNLASRLETAATPGEILLSYETYALVKNEIDCEPHGEINVKGIAYPVATYQVAGIKKKTKAPARIREELPNLKLAVNLDEMSREEACEAQVLLRAALEKVSNKK